MTQSAIIHKINELQKEEKITNRQLSQATGIGEATIYRLKNGTNIELSTLQKILDYFNHELSITEKTLNQ